MKRFRSIWARIYLEAMARKYGDEAVGNALLSLVEGLQE